MPLRRRPLLAGNWKMNGLRGSLGEFSTICGAVADGRAGPAEVVICPPATLLMAAARICEGTPIALGGQHCHSEPDGPFTGDISAEMLRDAGASYVIVGHSERRSGHKEGNEAVRRRAAAAFRAGLRAIVCVGETLEERETGGALPLVSSQLAGSLPEESTPENLVVAYEPVWAIGTGLTPSPPDIESMHGFIRAQAEHRRPGLGARLRILYGGSVKPANAAQILRIEDVDGALVGGASLHASEFMEIAKVYR